MTAKRRKLIADDPMVFVQNLREAKADVDPFTLEEAQRLIGQDRAIITVLVFCGLMPDGALALRWEDVDFEREQLRIRRSIHRFAGIGLPKTASSEREVDMLAPVVDEIQEQRARTQLRGELVLLNEVGGPIDLRGGAGDRGRTGDVQLGNSLPRSSRKPRYHKWFAAWG